MATKITEESDVGILYYVSQLEGFRGILKQRYSDFIVNEVDGDGNVVHLTTLDAPPEVNPVNEVKTYDQSNNNYVSEIELFRSLAGDSDAEHLKFFIDQINSNSEVSILPFVLSPNSDKSHRTEVHRFFRENFKFLVTDTIDGPDAFSKCIRVRLNSPCRSDSRNTKKRKEKHGGEPFDGRGSDHWPEEVGKFLRFHLYKENKDTHEALRVIGKMLGILPRSFGFSGTKDKRSVSTQRVTVFKQRASKLAGLNSRLIDIKVGDFCYVKEGLLLGQLLGNRFTITLRGVVADSEDTIKASANALGRRGFLNYFGLQRFGSGSVPTHLIGATLLRGEWKAAVDMILDPRFGDTILKAREYFKESDDIEGTIRQMPLYMIAERATLQSLKKFPGNYLQALRAIPRTLRMMYVHSYQSYLWNHATSMRVQNYGMDGVVIGDLVYLKGYTSEKMRVDVVSECGDDEDHDCVHLNKISETEFQEESYIPVKVITAEDLASGNYSLDDVVLPLPGSRVIYPNNDVAAIFHDLAKKYDILNDASFYEHIKMIPMSDVSTVFWGEQTHQEGISLTESSHNVKEFSITSMTGGYRRVLQKPSDFEWEVIRYSDNNIALAETDLEIILKEKDTRSFENENDPKASEIVCTGREEGDDDKQTQVAVKLGFTLPASSYATMAIRELLKTSTSVAFHKTLN